MFLGGYEKLREAGVALLGGHTVRDKEVKFGYAVTGAVDPDRVLTNAGARAGDVLLLTKPLGTGIAGTAIKFGRRRRPPGAAVGSMTTLNARAAQVLSRFGPDVHACTDITGFGLIGYVTEVATASGVDPRHRDLDLPVFPGVLEIAARNRSGGTASQPGALRGRDVDPLRGRRPDGMGRVRSPDVRGLWRPSILPRPIGYRLRWPMLTCPPGTISPGGHTRIGHRSLYPIGRGRIDGRHQPPGRLGIECDICRRAVDRGVD